MDEPWREWLWTNEQCIEAGKMYRKTDAYMDGSTIEDSLNNVVDVDFTPKPALRLITGGPPPSDTWLDRLSTGTSFVVRPKAFDGYLLREFCLGGRRDKATMIISIDNGEKMRMDWVDPIRFCQQLDLYEITEEPDHEVLCDS